MVNTTLVRRTKKTIAKKSNYKVVDLDHLTADLTLSKYLSEMVKRKIKKPVLLLNKEGQFNDFWIRDLLPEWKAIWHPRGVKITYNRKKQSFLLKML